MRSRKQSGATLTVDQLNELVAIVTEAHGSGLSRQDFCDAMLMLFEDIAGLETLATAQRNKLLTKLWSRYQRSTADLQRQ